MSSVYVVNHVTLDGVVQGPGRADEDTRGGFMLGGWAAPGVDDVLTSAMGARISAAGGLRLLLGRRTYEGVLGYWNTQESPFTEALNAAPKHVVSTTLREPLRWPNSSLVTGDVVSAVAALRQEPGNDLCVMGSGALIQALLPHGLIDEFLLFVHPLVLGTGRRLFPDGGAPASARLVGTGSNDKGVLVAHYRVGD